MPDPLALVTSAPDAAVRTAAPHPALAGLVQAYVQITGRVGGVVPVSAVPSAFLFVTWGDPVRILSASSRHLPLVSLFGLGSQAHQSEVGAGSHGFHLRLSPTGARALLAERPAADAWHDALPASVQRWAEETAAAPTFHARVALADAFWRRRVSERAVWSASASALIQRSGGLLSVTRLAYELGVSPRTLRRRFVDDVGAGIKTYAQLERHRQTHNFLLRAPGATWRDACERFGYADQAHFVRSFQRITGTSPTRWTTNGYVLDFGFGLASDGA